MAKQVAASRQRRRAPDPGGPLKATYSLPASIVRELERRSAGLPRGKSRVVAEALAFYFAAQDRRALGVLYAEAAQDPDFKADNDAVQEDFALLDRELDRRSR